jgi:hypothetical protein
MKEVDYKNMYNNINVTYSTSTTDNAISPRNKVEQAILDECNEFARFLVEKNRAYGNSALNPCRIMSKANTTEQLYVRIDDKLNRLMNGSEYPGDNDIQDLIGYLILLQVAKKGFAE